MSKSSHCMDRDTVEPFVAGVGDLEDSLSLEQAIAANGQKPLVVWDQAKVLLGFGD